MTYAFWHWSDDDIAEFFAKMTEEQARAFFQQYVAASPERLALLDRRFDRTGGGNIGDLDFTPDSLEQLWPWVMSEVRIRDYTAIASLRNMEQAPTERDMSLSRQRLSDDSLILLNDTAYYLAELLIRMFKGVEWTVSDGKKGPNPHLNQPVLTGFKFAVNPFSFVRKAADQTLLGKAGDDALLEVCQSCYYALED